MKKCLYKAIHTSESLKVWEHRTADPIHLQIKLTVNLYM